MSDQDRQIRQLPGSFELQPGFHGAPEDGLCALEAVAWLAGLPHSDQPACVCEVLATLLRSTNDHMPHFQRQRLIPFLPRLIDTRNPALAGPRATALTWRALTVFAPIPLAAAGLLEPAAALSQLSRRNPAAAAAAVDRVAGQVNEAAWAEAKANGTKNWDINAKVSPAMWAAVELVRLAQAAMEHLTAEDDWPARATTAAQIVSVACRFDPAAWSLALDALEELLAIGQNDAAVVSLADYRRVAPQAA